MLPAESITNKIYFIRDHNVMLDRDLAKLYGIKTKALKQAVSRNTDRFPDGFMFRLDKKEFEHWRSQFVTSNSGDKMGLRHPPMVFTEQGVAMLSSVLNSKRAIQVNIQIIKTFVRLRQMMLDHKELQKKIEDMEEKYDRQFKIVFDAIKQLLAEEKKPKRTIGF
jgi:ORF6N domain